MTAKINGSEVGRRERMTEQCDEQSKQQPNFKESSKVS